MGLYSKIVDLQKLGQAWEKVRSNNPSAGTDQISCAQFDANSRIELKQLNLELYNHEYRVRPVRLVSLEKEEKVREVSLYTMRDKVVQTSIAQELSRIYEPKFSPCVYAYRNDRSAMGAAERIEKEIGSGRYSWIAKTDIESFFDRIRVPLLKRKLERVIKEEDVIELIEMQLSAPALGKGGALEEKTLGIYQGSSISPVLSNIYLDDFDHMMEREAVFYVRYSDDILLLGKSREQLQTVLAKIKILLEPYGLNLKEAKTFINPLEQGLEFLGYAFDRNGKTATQKALQRLDQSLEDLWLTQSQLSLEERLKKGTQILNGWEQYYNKEEKIQSISEYVVLVYMLRNKSQLEEFAHRRSEFKNFHRDIAEYLIGVWEENGWKDLVILEYEQYFQIEASSDETYQELDSHSQREILDSFGRLFQAETQENWSELMQLYADAGRYSQAEKIVDKITKFSEQSESVETLCAEDLPSEEQKEDIETQIQKFNRKVITAFMELLVGREDLYAHEEMEANGRRHIETIPDPFTEDIVKRHLSGEETVDTYVMRNNETVHYMVIDIDISKRILLELQGKEIPSKYLLEAAKTAKKVMECLRKLGLTGYCEFSGYRGYHVWIFFSEWIPVRYVYSLEEVIAAKVKNLLEEGTKEAPSANTIEFFPWKSRRKTKEPGQAIKLPYGMHLIGKKRSYFCDDQMMPVQNLQQWFGAIVKSDSTAVKRIISMNLSIQGAQKNLGNGQIKPAAFQELDYQRLGVVPESVRLVLQGCSLMSYLVNKAISTGYLAHGERLSVLYVFGHMGEEGREFVHTVMSFTLNYQYFMTEKFIKKLLSRPISCIKLREQYKSVTAEYGCNCMFKRTKNCYPSPVLHAIKKNSEESNGITLPVSRNISEEKKKAVYQEINIHAQVQELAEKIVEFKRQKKGIDKSIEKVERELHVIFNNAKIDCMEVSMGMLVRRKKGEKYEWVIEI